jgi:hypothetical protein
LPQCHFICARIAVSRCRFNIRGPDPHGLLPDVVSDPRGVGRSRHQLAAIPLSMQRRRYPSLRSGRARRQLKLHV